MRIVWILFAFIWDIRDFCNMFVLTVMKNEHENKSSDEDDIILADILRI